MGHIRHAFHDPDAPIRQYLTNIDGLDKHDPPLGVQLTFESDDVEFEVCLSYAEEERLLSFLVGRDLARLDHTRPEIVRD